MLLVHGYLFPFSGLGSFQSYVPEIHFLIPFSFSFPGAPTMWIFVFSNRSLKMPFFFFLFWWSKFYYFILQITYAFFMDHSVICYSFLLGCVFISAIEFFIPILVFPILFSFLLKWLFTSILFPNSFSNFYWQCFELFYLVNCLLCFYYVVSQEFPLALSIESNSSARPSCLTEV